MSPGKKGFHGIGWRGLGLGQKSRHGDEEGPTSKKCLNQAPHSRFPHQGCMKKKLLGKSSKKELKEIIEAQESTIQFMATLIGEEQTQNRQRKDDLANSVQLNELAQKEMDKLTAQLEKTKEKLSSARAELKDLKKRSNHLLEENTFLNQENLELQEKCSTFRFHHGSDELSDALTDLPALPPMDETISECDERAGSYELLRILGQGNLGTVFAAKDDRTFEQGRTEEFAIKRIEKRDLDSFRYIKQLNDEVQALETLQDHSNVVALKETFHGPKYFYLVFEKAWSDVHEFSKTPWFTRSVLLEIMKGLFQALQFLHHNNYAHLDVKPDNILLRKPSKDREQGRLISAQDVMICDFGLCAHSPGNPPGLVMGEGGCVMGTNNFFAPELCNEQVMDAAMADMWSSGATLMELGWGFPPSWVALYRAFDDKSHVSKDEALDTFPDKMYNYLSRDMLSEDIQMTCESVPEMTRNESALFDLIINHLLVRPEKRMTSSNIMEHAWFSS